MNKEAWATAQRLGTYAPDELDRQGFLHCCTAQQLDFVLGRHFAGVAGLVIICFESDLVPAELRWVDSEPDQPPFPHLYGPIPLSAVRRQDR